MNTDENMNDNQEMNNEETEHEESVAEHEGSGDEKVQKDYKKEYEELYDRYIRLAADFDNYKKRTAKEKSDISAYGNEELIKSILDVVDNLERALSHADTGQEDGSLVEGVKLVHNQLLSCLQRFGLEKIEADKGTEFDPRYHQAFERVETQEVSPGLILSEVVKGYKLKDRLLRPAVVSVAVEPAADMKTDDANAQSEVDVQLSNENEDDGNDDSGRENDEGVIDLTDEDITE